MFKESGIDVVEGDLVVESGCDQGEEEGEEVDEDGDAAGSKHQHLLNLLPFKLSQIIPDDKLGKG